MKSLLIHLFCVLLTSVAVFSSTSAQQMLTLVSPANGQLGLQTEVGSTTTGKILVTNIGPLTGDVIASGDNRTEFVIRDTASYFLAIADTISFTVEFTPKFVGLVIDTIQIESTLGRIWIVLMGTGTAGAPGAFVIQPSAVNLGTVLVGAHSDRNFQITNTSASTESFTLNFYSGAHFSVQSPQTFDVGSGQTATARIRFSPAAAGAAFDSLVVTNQFLSRTIVVYGNGLLESDSLSSFTVDTTSIDFGSIAVGADTVTSLSVTNIVASAQQFDMHLAIGTEFTLGHAGTLDLAGLSTATFTIEFHPTAAGSHVDTLIITNGISTIRVILKGRGTTAPVPSFHLNPTSLYFGPGQPGDTFTGTVSIVNEMSTSLTLVNAIIIGVDATDFTVSNPRAYPLTMEPNDTLVVTIESALREDLRWSSAMFVVVSATDTAVCSLYQSYDSVTVPRDTVKVRVENTSGLIGGTADVVVTLLSDLPPTATHGEITYEFNASVMTPIRMPMASVIEGGQRRVSFDFEPTGTVGGQILTKEQFILTLGDAETTPVSIVSLKLFDESDQQLKSVTISNDALLSVEDASNRTVNANNVGLTLQLAPNPAFTAVTAAYTSTTAPSHLTIYNNMGMLVADMSDVLPQSLDGTVQIALDTFGTGTYMIRLSSETSTIVRTLVKY